MMTRDDIVITLFPFGPPPAKETVAHQLPPAQHRKATMTPEQLAAIGCTPDGCYRPGRAPKREIKLPEGHWYQVLPYGVARSQTAWEARWRVLRGREAGCTFQAMAIKLGVSRSRVMQMHEQAAWERRWESRSPVELWLAQDHFELHALANGIGYVGDTPLISGDRRMKRIREYYNRKNLDPHE